MRARRAPASMPGKKPTATAAPEKRGHRGVLPPGTSFVESMPVAEVVEAAGLVEVDEAEGDLELVPVELVALLITHCESLSQV